MIRIIFLLIVVALTSDASAQSRDQHELVLLVQERKKLMFDMQTAYFSLLSITRGKSMDLQSAADDARLIGEKIGMFVDLLVPDTAVEQVPNSRAKPEIWTEPEEFAAAVESLRNATAGLSEAALTGSIESFNERFKAVAYACGGCHDLKPSSGGRFRSSK